MEIRYQVIAAQPVLARRTSCKRAAVAATIGASLGAAWPELARQRLHADGGPYTRYLGATPDSLEIEVGLITSKLPEASPGWVATMLPGGRTAVCTFVGETDINGALAAVREAGEVVSGPPWSVYMTDPGTEPDRSKWVTDVYVPVA